MADAPLEVFGYRFTRPKEAVLRAVFEPGDRVRFVTVLGWTARRYPEAARRADESLVSATRRPRTAMVRALRLGLLRAQYNVTRAFFEARPGAVAAVWNGLVSDRRIFMMAARDAGARTLFLERGPFAGTITADPVGVNHANGLPRDGQTYRDWLGWHPEASGAWRPLAEKLMQRAPAVSKSSDLAQLPPLDGPFVFVPLQKHSDTQLRLFGRLCRGVPQTIALLRAAAEALPAGWHLRLKEHPSDRSRFEALVPATPGGRLFLDNSTDTFAQVRASRAVLTVNSSVGLEAMLLEKPVVAMGEAYWVIDGIATAADNLGSLKRVLADPDALRFDAGLRDAFLSLLVTHYYPKLDRSAATMSAADRANIRARILSGSVLSEART